MHRVVAVLVTVLAATAGCATPYQSSQSAQCPPANEAAEADGPPDANASTVTVWVRNDAMRDAVVCVSVNDEGPVRADVPARGRAPVLMEAFNVTLADAELVVDATEARADLSARERFTRGDANHVVVTLTKDERLTIEYRTTPPEPA